MNTLKRAIEDFRYTIGSNDRYLASTKGIHGIDLALIMLGLAAMIYIATHG